MISQRKYASGEVPVMVGLRLFLPESWTSDPARGENGDRGKRRRGQDVEDHLSRMDTLAEGLAAGRFNRRQAVDENGGHDMRRGDPDCRAGLFQIDALYTISTIYRSPSWPLASMRLTPQAPPGKTQSLNSAPKSAGLSGQHRNIMPGIVDCHAAAEGAAMLADHFVVLADDDAIRICVDLDRPTALTTTE